MSVGDGDGWELSEPVEFATVVAAVCEVAAFASARRGSQHRTNYVGEAIEGAAIVALQGLLSWAQQLPSREARHVEARIRACLRHGDRTLLGAVAAGRLVAEGRRILVRD